MFRTLHLFEKRYNLNFTRCLLRLYSGSQIDVRFLGRSIPVQRLPFYSQDSGGDAVAPRFSFITI